MSSHSSFPDLTPFSGDRSSSPVLGTNLEGVNTHNRRVILDAIRVNRALSRADLARATKLSKQTVSNIVDELELEGMIVAQGTVARGIPGRPAIPYILAPDGAYAIGLHLDYHDARAVIVDLVGEVLLSRTARLPVDNPSRGLEILLALLAEARDAGGRLRPELETRLVGLGVAMPGPFGVPVPNGADDDYFSMARWQRFPLISSLKKNTGLEVSLRNDAAAAAMAELMSGRLHGVRDAVCLYLGYGLGAGIIINGELYTGRNGNAGDVGPIPGQPGPTSRPPLERLATLAALAEKLGRDPADPDYFARITHASETKEPAYQDWLEKAVGEIDWLVTVMELVFAPDAIVLCGSAPDRILDDVLASLGGRRKTGRSSRLVRGLADQWAPARGAASEPINRAFSPLYAALFKK